MWTPKKYIKKWLVYPKLFQNLSIELTEEISFRWCHKENIFSSLVETYELPMILASLLFPTIVIAISSYQQQLTDLYIVNY